MNPGADRLAAALADRYRVERELGAGGMATVYLAEDLKHDRKVAIKVLKPELAAVLGAERFVVEIKTTAAMSHPHILPLFDSGTADGFLFYVMPYIQGETIREKLNRETQFGVEEAVRIAREVADALDYAHRHGIIHRDIKPENILLHDGRAMVMDFGIALAVSAAAGGRMTETGLSLGTPHYMSPEQATAEKEITPRSDVYSLASVLYEMLAGQPPHIGGAAQQIIMKIITEPAAPVTAMRKNVAPNVVAALSRALEKLPADRFESAKAFGDALANATFAHSTAAIAAGTAHQASVYRSTPFLAVAAIAMVATAFAVWSARGSAARPREISRFSLLLPDSQRLTDNVVAQRLAVSPDGRTIVYVGPSPTEPAKTQLWMRPLDQLRATPIAGTEMSMNPAFSPDGRHLAFTSFAGKRSIKRVSLDGGPALTLTDSLVDAGGVTWASDGYIYYDGHFAGDGMGRVKEAGGVAELATSPDSATGESYHYVPSALPDGRGVLFTVARGSDPDASDIGVLDFSTRKHKVLTRGIRAQYMAPGYLVIVTSGGALMAAPFDLETLSLTGDGVALASGLSVRGNARADLAVSDDGLLAYSGGSAFNAARELVWVTRDGSATSVDPSWVAEISSRPVLSPDAQAVVFSTGPVGSRQLWVKQLDRGPAVKLAEGGFGFPTWSPDGKWIYSGGTTGVWRMAADASSLPVQLWKSKYNVQGANVTSDGTWVVFSSNGDLFALGTGGDTVPRTLVEDAGIQTNPVVSPDGKWLAYQSDESGVLHVYVRPFPDTKVARRQVSSVGGALPRWSPDGRELLYVETGSADLISVPVVPGAAFATGVPSRLFNLTPYSPTTLMTFDVARDGARLLLSRAVGSVTPKPDELVLVQNFIEEVKAKVKPK